VKGAMQGVKESERNFHEAGTPDGSIAERKAGRMHTTELGVGGDNCISSTIISATRGGVEKSCYENMEYQRRATP